MTVYQSKRKASGKGFGKGFDNSAVRVGACGKGVETRRPGSVAIGGV